MAISPQCPSAEQYFNEHTLIAELLALEAATAKMPAQKP